MRRIRSTSLVAAAVAAAMGLFVMLGAGESQAAKLSWLTYKPKGAGDPQATTTQWFADELKKRTGGKYEIEIHWGGSVAKINEIPNALTNGLGDIGDVVTPYFPDKLLINNAISFFIPQPKTSIELGAMMERWHQTYPQFDQEMAKYNLKVVGYRPLESYGMICTKPIRSAKEFNGVRIRSYGFALPALIKAMGGTPVSMDTPQAYEALQRGILDCSPVGPTLAHGWKYDEVAKYFIDIFLGASWGHLITMNRNSYNKLDEVTRAILEGIGSEYLVKYANLMEIDTGRVKDTWKKKMGVTIVPFPREDVAKASESELVQNVRKEWIEKAKKQGLAAAEDIAAELRF